jgi:RimJ/RimL family protein N-acetyltransferase
MESIRPILAYELLTKRDPIIIEDEQKRGFQICMYVPEIKVVYIAFGYIFPEYRGKGVGTILNEKTIEIAKKIGAEKIYSETGIENEAGNKAMQKIGFKEVAHNIEYVYKIS